MRLQQNYRVKYHFFVFFCIFCLLSCQTFLKKKPVFPDNFIDYQEGVFYGSLMVYHQNKQENHLKVSIAVSKDDDLRMDLTASLGFPILSILLKKENGTILFFASKKFYKGAHFQTVIDRFFKYSINLRILKNVLFDRPPKEKHWKCNNDELQRPVSCKYQNNQILWQRQPKRAIDFITSTSLRVVFSPSDFSPEVEKTVFTLKIPEHFTPINLLK